VVEHHLNKMKVVGSNPPLGIKKQMKFGVTWGQKLGRPECPYMRRWVLNFNTFSIRIHHWLSSDDDRCFHCHPWNFYTLVLKGRYIDLNENGEEQMKPGSFAYRKATHKHTVKVAEGGCWTLILTGSQMRSWGFWPKGK
jgi:hypothetical protein